MKKLFLGVLVFGAGAVTATLLAAVRDARADQESPRSAYFCFEAADVSELTVKANAAGQRGWRMVAATPSRGAGVWCFTQSR